MQVRDLELRTMPAHRCWREPDRKPGSSGVIDNWGMQFLRNAKTLARLVLLFFALAMGAAVASPLMKTSAMELVCDGSGTMKLVAGSHGEAPATGAHLLDCPLCIGAVAPPALDRPVAQLHPAPARQLSPLPSTPIAAKAAAALPARGPPAFS